LVESHPAVPLAQVLVLTPGGCAADPADRSGLGRHAAELMRRGAGGLSRAELDEKLDHLGASIDVVTSTDAIGFLAHGLARHLPTLVDLLADVLARPTLAADEHERLRRESLALLDDVRDDDGSLCARFFEREVFPGHAYGQSSLGTEASLGAMTLADVHAWRHQAMDRRRALIGFAGAVPEVEALTLAPILAAAFAEAEPSQKLPGPAAGPVALPSARRTLLIDKPERTQSHILVGHAGPARRDPAWLPLQLGATAFGGTFTSRLTTEVRVKRGWSYGASCRLGRGRFGSSFRIKVFPSTELVRDTLALVLELWREVADKGLSAEEIEFARGYLAGSWAFELATPADRLGKKLDLELLDLPGDTFTGHLQRLAAITPDEVNDAIRRFWHPEHAAVVLTGTARDLEPRLGGLDLGPLNQVAYDSY
jgi:zinc protease